MPGQSQNGHTAHNKECKCTPRPVPTNQKLNRPMAEPIHSAPPHYPPPPIQTEQPPQNNADTSEPRCNAL